MSGLKLHPQQIDLITQCFDASKHCTVATNGLAGWPESATVAFAAAGLDLVFATWKSTRKYKNIQQDNRVSFVIGFESGVNIQLEGEAEPIEEDHQLVDNYLQKKPSAQHYMDDPEYVFFKVRATWLRYSDFREQPIQKFEVTLPK